MAPLFNHDSYLRLIRGEDRSRLGGITRAFLSAASGPYRCVTVARNHLFDKGMRRICDLGRPVVSVGNITVGGTGKTPMVVEIVRRLRHLGHRPAVLLRGYGGDETRELGAAFADAEPIVPVQANPNRAEQAAHLLKRHPEVDVFVLDDAFQHRQVHRDLDLVLIDATDPFGGGRVLPRGLLREPMSNLHRADAVVITRCDQVDAESLSVLDKQVESLTGRRPLAHTAAQWRGLRSEAGPMPAQTLGRQKVMGACGIGNARVFERQLRQCAKEVVAVDARNDHYRWTGKDLRALLGRAADSGAEAVVTTEKDWVKWRPLLAGEAGAGIDDFPIYRPILAIHFVDGEDAFARMLAEVSRTA